MSKEFRKITCGGCEKRVQIPKHSDDFLCKECRREEDMQHEGAWDAMMGHVSPKQKPNHESRKEGTGR